MVKKLVLQEIQYINAFERVANVRPKDCFSYGGCVIFVVSPLKLSKAIGQQGESAKKLSGLIKKKIKIIPFDDEYGKEKFIEALVYPAKYKEINFAGTDDGCVSIKATPQNKAMLIGRNGSRLKELKDILKKYFKVEDVRIV